MRQLVKLTIFGFRLAPILLAIYWIMLFTGTHLPGSAIKTFQVGDKLLHFLAFAGLAFLMAWSLPRRIGRVPGLAVAAAMTLVYAVIDEYTQGFVPHRTPDVQDFVADSLGMLLGFTVYLVLRWLLIRVVSGRPPVVRSLRQADTNQRIVSHRDTSDHHCAEKVISNLRAS